MAMKVVRQARLELSGGSTPDQLRPQPSPPPPESPPPHPNVIHPRRWRRSPQQMVRGMPTTVALPLGGKQTVYFPPVQHVPVLGPVNTCPDAPVGAVPRVAVSPRPALCCR